MRRLLLLVCAIVLADTMLYAALAPLLPQYADEFGLSKGEAGLLVGAYAAGAFVAALPAGLAAARFGPRRVVIGGLVLMAIASMAFGLADSGLALGGARFAQGIGSALSWTGGLSWLVAGTPRGRRGEMIGTAMGAAIFGALLGPAVGAVAEALGALPVFSAIAGLSILLVAWALRTPPTPADPQPARAYLGALREPVVLAALWLIVMPAVLFGAVSVLVPLDLGAAGWSAAGIAAAFIGAAAIEMVVAPLWGRFSDRRGRLLPLRIALAGGIAATSALAFVSQPGLIVVFLVATAVAFGAFWAPAMALLADGADRMGLAQGLAFGLLNAAWGAGNSIGPPLAGALADVAGDALPYGLMALACALTLVAVSRGRKLLGTPLAASAREFLISLAAFAKMVAGTPLSRVPATKSFRKEECWMNLQPLGDRLIVEALDEEEMTASGIVLPDTAKEKPQRGRVLAVGPGPRDEDGEYVRMDLEPGRRDHLLEVRRHRHQARGG